MNKKKIATAAIFPTCIALVLAFSILTFFTLNGSAWFSTNKRGDSDGVQIELKDIEKKIKRIEYYPIASITLEKDDSATADATNTYHFSTTQTTDAIALRTASALSAERQILMKVVLVEGVEHITIRAASDAKVYITEPVPQEDGSTVPAFISKTENGISSVIQFEPVSGIGDDFIVTDAMRGAGVHFATIEQDEDTVTPAFATDITLYSGTVTEGELYFIIDYYQPSVDYLTDLVSSWIMMGDTSKTDLTETERQIPFACDFIFEIL